LARLADCIVQIGSVSNFMLHWRARTTDGKNSDDLSTTWTAQPMSSQCMCGEMKRADFDKTMLAYQALRRSDNSISNSVLCDRPIAHHFTADCPKEDTATDSSQVWSHHTLNCSLSSQRTVRLVAIQSTSNPINIWIRLNYYNAYLISIPKIPKARERATTCLSLNMLR